MQHWLPRFSIAAHHKLLDYLPPPRNGYVNISFKVLLSSSSSSSSSDMKVPKNFHIYLSAGSALLHTTQAATCNLKPSYAAPVVSNGWQAQLVATGLFSPRGIIFDSSGNLLVVQQGAGIIHLEFDDGGSTCLDVSKKTYLINSTSVSGKEFLYARVLKRLLAKSWNCSLC